MASLLDNILSFGATPPKYLGSLIGEDELKNVQNRAATTGIFNALVGYLATPKNQNLGLGTILGNTLMAGQQGAQGVYEQAVQDYQTTEKIKQMQIERALQAQKIADQQNMRRLAPQLIRDVPAQTELVDQGSYFIPKPTAPDAVAPNYGLQQVVKDPIERVVSPARREIDPAVLQQLLATSSDPLGTLKTAADLVPALRKAGMLQTQSAEENPFDIWVETAQSPQVKNVAKRYQKSYRDNLLDETQTNRAIEMIAKNDESYIARTEGAAQRKAQDERDYQLRKQLGEQGIDLRKQGLDLQTFLAQNKIDQQNEKANEKKQVLLDAQQQLADSIDGLRSDYLSLRSGGGIVDKNKSWKENVGAYIGSSGVGQIAGRMLGTSNQSIRNEIVQKRPLLLNLIKNATGMSAKQMDSNAELKMYLMAATDPELDIDANLAALDNLEKTFIKNPAFRSQGNTAVPNTFYDENDPAFKALPKGTIFIDGNTGRAKRK